MHISRPYVSDLVFIAIYTTMLYPKQDEEISSIAKLTQEIGDIDFGDLNLDDLDK